MAFMTIKYVCVSQEKNELQKLFFPWLFYKQIVLYDIKQYLWSLRKSLSSKYWIGIILCSICNRYENDGFILMLCSILLYVSQVSQFYIDFFNILSFRRLKGEMKPRLF